LYRLSFIRAFDRFADARASFGACADLIVSVARMLGPDFDPAKNK
jgi:hypothetical protein